MLKISRNHSTGLSLLISVLFFLGCLLCAFLIPSYSEAMVALHITILQKSSRPAIIVDELVRTGFVMALSYSVLLICILADFLLFSLLLRVRKGLVFTERSVALIRGVSWCCLIMGIVFCFFGLMFRAAFILAFVAVFLGLCLRIVKNVIEEATVIKRENDLTV